MAAPFAAPFEVVPLAGCALESAAALAAQAPDPWSAKSLARAVEDPRRLCLAAVRESGGSAGQSAALLGFACFFVVEDAADLEQIVVDAAARRAGVATALLAAAAAPLATMGAARLLLEVRAGNAPALALYEKLGFKTLARRPGMYKNPGGHEDGFLMGKALG